jgi:UDP-N-acetylglucosamine--N-acetylmuramyl-(pentapeptide) pyrophosphoryl-undecaprenol N-acetylglucosamine transferase
LNNAARESWPLFRESGLPVRLIHQAGTAMAPELAAEFATTGLLGEVSAFLTNMPAAFAQADLVVGRAGAGAVSELAAAGKPSVLIPFPFAADDHQLRNAEAFVRAGAAEMSLDHEWNGAKFFELTARFSNDRGRLARMGECARKLARRGAAQRAAEILIDCVSFIDSSAGNRNNI